MKLMKLMFAGILVLSFAFAQDDNPCDPNMTYEVADPGPDGGCGDYADCNGNGAFDLGEPCFEQPPFDDVDANGDGKIDREEARAFWGDDPNFDQQFDDVDTDGSGDVDQAEFDAAGNDDGQDHDGMGDHDGMTQLDHRIEGIKMFLNDMANNGVLASEDIDFLVNEAERLEEAVHSEWDGNDGAAGEVMGEIQAWLNDNVEDPGVRDHYLHELCMLEYEAHKEHGGSEGDPDCGPMDHGGPGGPGGPNGPSPAVMNAWGSGQQSDGSFDFEAAFDAAEATAKAEAQAEGTYAGDEAWGECVEVGRNAMNAARDDDKSPMDVFQAIAQAVNECGEAQANQN